MKEFKIKQIRVHQPTNIAGQVTHSVEISKHKVEMTLTPIGVHLKGNGIDRLIFFNNCYEADLLHEEKSKKD
jgi:hypothetical protein